MANLDQITKILNPADPTLTGLIPLGATVAGGVANLAGSSAASGAEQAGLDSAKTTVSDAGAKIPGITADTLAQQKSLLDPYAQAGGGALDQLSAGIKPGGGLTDPFHYDPNDQSNDPSYQFTLSEGDKALRAELARQGIDYSGGAARSLDKYNTGLANQFYSQNYSRAQDTFNQNKAQRLKALQDISGMGLQAAGTESAAVGHAGDQNVQGTEWTATQIADLQAQKADAIAAGDLGKAKAIGDTIAGVANTISGNGALANIMKAIPGAVSNGGGASPLSVLQSVGMDPGQDMRPPAGTPPFAGNNGQAPAQYPDSSLTAPIAEPQAGNLGQIAGLGGTAATAASSAAVGSAPLTGYAGGGLITSHGAAIGMLTNPITIGIGAGLIALTAILKNQTHWTADKLTDPKTGPQAIFDSNVAKIRDGFESGIAQGMTKDQGMQAKAGLMDAARQYSAQLDAFAAKGSKERKVVAQDRANMDKVYGPNFSILSSLLDSQIARMA